MTSSKAELEAQIKELMTDWAEEHHKEVQGLQKVRYAGHHFGNEEYTNLLDAIFKDWWSG
jgi:hypothetical protein